MTPSLYPNSPDTGVVLGEYCIVQFHHLLSDILRLGPTHSAVPCTITQLEVIRSSTFLTSQHSYDIVEGVVGYLMWIWIIQLLQLHVNFEWKHLIFQILKRCFQHAAVGVFHLQLQTQVKK